MSLEKVYPPSHLRRVHSRRRLLDSVDTLEKMVNDPRAHPNAVSALGDIAGLRARVDRAMPPDAAREDGLCVECGAGKARVRGYCDPCLDEPVRSDWRDDVLAALRRRMSEKKVVLGIEDLFCCLALSVESVRGKDAAEDMLLRVSSPRDPEVRHNWKRAEFGNMTNLSATAIFRLFMAAQEENLESVKELLG